MRIKRVIVLDDNEMLLRAWERILLRDGVSFFVTSHPEEAIEAITSEGVDLLICDLVMPQMDGFEFLNRVKNYLTHTQIVITTGYVCDFSRLKIGLHSKDIHILLKPYGDLEKLDEFIQSLLNDKPILIPRTSLQNEDPEKFQFWNL
ncbi:MAG: response regulator [Deltaproteobacteria bacterium]|nr:response regulator [Deltaproteobacteria bacterium]